MRPSTEQPLTLQSPLRPLVRSASIRAACEALGVTTVGDFLRRPRRDFLAAGVRSSSHRALLRTLRSRVATRPAPPDLPDECRELPLVDCIGDDVDPALFLPLAVTTVGEFLALPTDRVLAVPGFTEDVYRTVLLRFERLGASRRQDPGLLPDAFLAFPLSGLGLPAPLEGELRTLGLRTLGHLLRLQPDWLLQQPAFGLPGVEAIRGAVERLVRAGLDQFAAPTAARLASFGAFLDALSSVLDVDEQEWLRMRIGAGCPAAGRDELGVRLGFGGRQARALDATVRRRLRSRAPALLLRIRDEARRELDAFEGLVEGERLASGSILHTAVKETGDPLLPLRLLEFCFPNRFHVHGRVLTGCTHDVLARILRRLRRATRKSALPVAMATIERQLGAYAARAPRGLVLHLLQQDLALLVTIDPEQGEVVERKLDSVGERLASILVDVGTPLSVDDLQFHYRDRHRRSNRANILDHLATDARFVRVGRDVYDLRSRNLDELAIAAIEAERLKSQVLTAGERTDVRTTLRAEGVSDRMVELVVDSLKRDPTLRALGRGEFCPALLHTSRALTDLRQAFRRAQGEVVTSRFVENQAPARRRLVQRLLAENRLFVEPEANRVDVLANYPFNEERMEKLLAAVDALLDRRHGYATIDEARTAVTEIGLGGEFLTAHLLRDLLRRQGRHELLPGDLIARESLGLGAWIQQRARETLRQTRLPMTADELIAQAPELAAFAETLEPLLGRDPTLVSVDGVRFHVV